MVDYSVSGIYQGGYSSLKPSYGDVFTGYYESAENLGLASDPTVGNVLQAISARISTGAKNVEVEGVTQKIMDSIPKHYFKEMKRMGKLTGVQLSLHGPMEEPSGLTQQGFSEGEREQIERQFINTVERGHELNPDGNVPVTFHASVLPFSKPQVMGSEGKKMHENVWAIDVEGGGFVRIPLKERYYPGEKKDPTVKDEITIYNEEGWMNKIRNLDYYAQFGERSIRDSGYIDRVAGVKEERGKKLSLSEEEAKREFSRGTILLNNSYQELKGLFDVAYKHGTDEEKKMLDNFRKNIEPIALKIKDNPDNKDNPFYIKDLISEGVDVLSKVKPTLIKTAEDFAMDKTTETFSNVALSAYDKFKEKAPIISIENHPAGDAAFTTGKELRMVVDKSREKFVQKAIKPKNKGGLAMSRSEAKKQAEKLIGATLDVGHMNMLRKFGYKEKDIIKEVKEVAPTVKHVHLSDNFGFEHTELPMGMGNVPVKEMLEKLPKKDVKKIIEAADWYKNYSTTALKENLEAFGTQMYSVGGPYWSQSLGFQQDYYTGVTGATFPPINYETWGGGWSQLPMELGGQRPGAQGSRMSGKPME